MECAMYLQVEGDVDSDIIGVFTTNVKDTDEWLYIYMLTKPWTGIVRQ
jgi:hypothetical protein